MASPASSPRLPSPPPMAEDQTGPVSPGGDPSEDYGKLGGTQNADIGASRRIRPGTKSEDMAEGPPLVDLQEIDSAFQLTEHLKALHASYTHPPSSPGTTTPIDKATAQTLAKPPPGVDANIWLYELCRFLTQKANAMAIGLFADTPACSSETCPEMRASEWQYLCAAHDPPKSCCAIDYTCHTLDWAATTLTSGKLFPSRLALGTENVSSAVQLRKMTEVFRRVYRIFAHAWFQHRDVFWKVESKTGLYVFFKAVCEEYHLIQDDNYTIPPEAEGIEVTPVAEQGQSAQPSLLRRGDDREEGGVEPAGNTTLATGNTTKRHRHTMSDRSSSVSTVIHEEVEEEDGWEDEGLGHPVQEVKEPKHFLESEGLPTEELQGSDASDGKPEEHADANEQETEPGLDQASTAEDAPAEEEKPLETPEEPASASQTQEPEAEQRGKEEQVVEPMEPGEAAAGEAQKATQSVAD